MSFSKHFTRRFRGALLFPAILTPQTGQPSPALATVVAAGGKKTVRVADFNDPSKIFMTCTFVTVRATALSAECFRLDFHDANGNIVVVLQQQPLRSLSGDYSIHNVMESLEKSFKLQNETIEGFDAALTWIRTVSTKVILDGIVDETNSL